MNRKLQILFVLVCASSLAAGCHWFRFGRKKRATAAEAQLTEVWRSYFAICLGTKIAADPTLAVNNQSWASNVDFTILHSVWYINVEQWLCNAVAGQDTGDCWKNYLSQYLKVGPVLTYSQECVDEFVEDTQSPSQNLRYFQNGRKKRGLSYPFPLPPTQPPINTTDPPLPTSTADPVQGYTACLESNAGTIPDTDPINYDDLTQFVRQYTVFGCEACGDACAEQFAPLPPNAPPQWPYKFLSLARTDSPIRNAISDCNDAFFPADPFWSEWSTYGPECPECGQVVQTRRRTCRSGVDPTMQVADSRCSGPSSEQRGCQIPVCQPPAWSGWGRWSPDCPPCGDGQTQERQRQCFSQFRQLLPVDSCPGQYLEIQECRIPSCRPNVWSQWSAWSPFCPTCGDLTMQTRERDCYDPDFTQILNPFDCPGGQRRESRYCDITQCVNSWGEWETWSPQCPSCAQGAPIFQTRQRACYSHDNRQLPPHDCGDGPGIERQPCQIPQCVNSWGEWQSWSPQCPSCAQSAPIVQSRRRICYSHDYRQLPPQDCTGPGMERQPCQIPQCEPVGRWGPWGRWAICSRQCTRKRARDCMPPNAICEGVSDQSQGCRGGYCPSVQLPNILWGPWSRWSQCKDCDTIGGGTRNRTRKCTYLVLFDIDSYNCQAIYGGDDNQTESCNSCPTKATPRCVPVWTDWSNWRPLSCYNDGYCDVTISRSRARRCLCNNQQVRSTLCSPELDVESRSCRRTCPQ